jgi:hypothetical protein
VGQLMVQCCGCATHQLIIGLQSWLTTNMINMNCIQIALHWTNIHFQPPSWVDTRITLVVTMCVYSMLTNFTQDLIVWLLVLDFKNRTFQLWPSHNLFHNVYIIYLMTLKIATHNSNYKSHYHAKCEVEMIRNKVRVTFQSCSIIDVLLQRPPPFLNMISSNSLVQSCWNFMNKCTISCSSTISSSKKI